MSVKHPKTGIGALIISLKSNEPAAKIATMKDIKNKRGGKRAGAGRKPDGKVSFSIRVFPQQIPEIEKFIAELNHRISDG